MKKEVSIEDLALMIGKGFAEVKSDLGALEIRLDDRIDKLEQHVDRRCEASEKRLSVVEAMVFRNHENRLNKIEKKLQIA